MKRVLTSVLLQFIPVVFILTALTEVTIAQTPTTPSNNVIPGGSGGILEPPGGGILDGVYTPEHISYRKPIPYTYTREADVMWQKRTWRVIDLREKINHPFYYPTDEHAKRPSLFNVIRNGIYSGKITSIFEFDVFTYEFGLPLTVAEVAKSMTEQLMMKNELGEPIMDSVGNQVFKPDTIGSDQIVQYYLKEDWFFEKQRSVMDVRIISIAPVIEVFDANAAFKSYKPLFWLYYPALRNYLSQHYCFNPYNDAEWRSYDEIFHKRLFNSYAMMESNAYNRAIASYLAGQSMEQLLESERIKDDIFKIEHDMWHF